MGLIELHDGRLFNTAIVVDRGALIGRYRKAHPHGGEKIFDPGNDIPVFEIAGLRFGINSCSDTNFPESAQKVADAGASPDRVPRQQYAAPTDGGSALRDVHNAVRGERCRETGLWLVSADVTGERDGCISWGPTAVLNPAGEIVVQLPLGKPGLVVLDVPRNL